MNGTEPVADSVPRAQSPFTVIARDPTTAARLGRLTTAHGEVETPVFMPVATQGTVKGLTPEQVGQLGARLILANAYHLSLRPGVTIIRNLGGLHRFMGWTGAILSDSGGYQIFSLAPLRQVTDDGVVFRSHVDGQRVAFTPESVVQLQGDIGVDVIMPLDECVEAAADRSTVERAASRTVAWAARSRAATLAPGQLLFGIVQGGLFADVRERQAGQLAALGFPGYAVGGLSVGESRMATREIAGVTASALPKECPRYLMGVGLPQDLLRFIGMGYDMFDCVLPTRNGRNGAYFTGAGRLNIRRAQYADDGQPPDPACGCYVCRTFSRAYLRHLALAGEMLGAQLATLHNLHFYIDLMRQTRAHIAAGTFGVWADDYARRMDGEGAQ